MLKFFFLCLLIANALLFALNRGYVANPLNEPHQPQRLNQQLMPQNLKLISVDQVTGTAAGPAVSAENSGEDGAVPLVSPVASTTAAAATAAVSAATLACEEWGEFGYTDLNRAEIKLKSLALGVRQSRLNAGDSATTIVLIPPLASKEAADKKALELTHLGVRDFFIIQDQSPLRWGISLGVFKSEELAKQLLASLVARGVHSARLSKGKVETNKFNYIFKNLSETEHSALLKISSDFPAQNFHSCKAG